MFFPEILFNLFIYLSMTLKFGSVVIAMARPCETSKETNERYWPLIFNIP